MNNDLISREALKKAIEQGEGVSWDKHGKDDLCVRKKYIDNAPTVSPFKPMCNAKDEAICEEMTTDGHCNYSKFCPNKENKRPQGVWTFDEKGYFYCDQCGKYPRDQYATTDFCPLCGADMRKGGAE